MNEIELTAMGRKNDDGEPVFAFNYSLNKQPNLDGRFDIAFALVDTDAGERFAVIDQHRDVLGVAPQKHTDTMISALLNHEAYTIVVNYDDVKRTSTRQPDNTVVPILGRDLGQSHDWIERTTLPDNVVDALVSMQDHRTS